jgi:hypothetical protein
VVVALVVRVVEKDPVVPVVLIVEVTVVVQ